jgi:hypothetical protein
MTEDNQQFLFVEQVRYISDRPLLTVFERWKLFYFIEKGSSISNRTVSSFQTTKEMYFPG